MLNIFNFLTSGSQQEPTSSWGMDSHPPSGHDQDEHASSGETGEHAAADALPTDSAKPTRSTSTLPDLPSVPMPAAPGSVTDETPLPKIPYIEKIKSASTNALRWQNQRLQANCPPSSNPAENIEIHAARIAPHPLARQVTSGTENQVVMDRARDLAGIESWAARFADLFSPILAGIPAWQHLDPIVLLDKAEKGHPEWNVIQGDEKQVAQSTANSISTPFEPIRP